MSLPFPISVGTVAEKPGWYHVSDVLDTVFVLRIFLFIRDHSRNHEYEIYVQEGGNAGEFSEDGGGNSEVLGDRKYFREISVAACWKTAVQF